MQQDMENAVLERYSEGAKAKQNELCCPVSYDSQYLKNIPKEIIEKDYGCGDPSSYINAGETVLDLGSGGGKIVYIAAQKVGAKGKVIGVDMNDDMLALAHKYEDHMEKELGFRNFQFVRGKIQDLATDLDQVHQYLQENPVKSHHDLARLESWVTQQRSERPLIADNSIDCIVSNCVLNLVNEHQRTQLFSEMFRVLKKGGRVAISDIVADEEVTAEMKADPVLWSGCISGSFTETGFLKAFEQAGFYGVEILKRDDQPWQTVQGIEFRSVVVSAYKGKQGACWDHHHAVIYRGPFSQVQDDDGHTYLRGERMAVCKKTFELLKNSPYQESFYFVSPREEIRAEDAKVFDCNVPALRSARVSKGKDYQETTSASAECCPTTDESPQPCC